jgi:hypothetical protein
MDAIAALTPDQARKLWHDYLSRQQLHPNLTNNYPQQRPVVDRSTRRLQVILTTDLVAAVNTKRDPSTATARILRRKTDGDLTLSTDSITIVNRFTQISVDAGTYAKAEHIDGEWQLYAADCPGGSASSGSV